MKNFLIKMAITKEFFSIGHIEENILLSEDWDIEKNTKKYNICNYFLQLIPMYKKKIWIYFDYNDKNKVIFCFAINLKENNDPEKNNKIFAAIEEISKDTNLSISHPVPYTIRKYEPEPRAIVLLQCTKNTLVTASEIYKIYNKLEDLFTNNISQ